MLYAQKRTVVNKPNPPSGPWSAQNNRPEGYANYLIGKFYLACEPNVITVNRPYSKKKRRGKAKEGQEAGEVPETDIVEDECQWWDGQEESAWTQETQETQECQEPWPQDVSWTQEGHEVQWQQQEVSEAWMEGWREQGPWTGADGAEWWSAWPTAETAEANGCLGAIPDWQLQQYGQYGYYAESQQETYAGSSYVASDGDASSATMSSQKGSALALIGIAGHFAVESLWQQVEGAHHLTCQNQGMQRVWMCLDLFLAHRDLFGLSPVA